MTLSKHTNKPINAMGYHLIILKENNQIQHEYCEHYHELADFSIQENSIIYQGEPHWKPFLVKDNDQYKGLADLRFRGSIKAEQLFSCSLKSIYRFDY